MLVVTCCRVGMPVTTGHSSPGSLWLLSADTILNLRLRLLPPRFVEVEDDLSIV